MRKYLTLFLLFFLLIASSALATVTATDISASYTCTGSTGPYPFTFPISDTTALEVVQDGTVLASSAYTSTPVNNDYTNGGSVTLNSACPLSSTLIVQRATPPTQQSSFTEYMPTPYKTFERALDKLIEIAQEEEAYAIANTTVQSPNFVLAGPSGGSTAGWPSFRALTMADLPSLLAPTLLGNITILGQVTTGSWQATPVAVAYGGTGASTAAGAKTNLGIGSISSLGVGSLINGDYCTYVTGTGIVCTSTGTSGSSMVYPSTGVGNSTGSAWGTSYQVGTSANYLVQLDSSAKLPAVDGSQLTNLPTPTTTPAYPRTTGLTVNNNSTTPNTKIDLAATQIMVGNYPVNSLSVTINAGTTGANGLDTGTQAASTWYFVYAVYNPTTTTGAGMLSTSASAPSPLPSGYTVSRLVGSAYSNSSTHFRRFIKKGDSVRYINTGSGLPAMGSTSGSAVGSVSTPTWVAIAVGNYTPSTATIIHLAPWTYIYQSLILAPNNSYGAWNSTTNPPLYSAYGYNDYPAEVVSMMLESTNIYWACQSTGAIYCYGYEEPL